MPGFHLSLDPPNRGSWGPDVPIGRGPDPPAWASGWPQRAGDWAQAGHPNIWPGTLILFWRAAQTHPEPQTLARNYPGEYFAQWENKRGSILAHIHGSEGPTFGHPANPTKPWHGANKLKCHSPLDPAIKTQQIKILASGY